MIITKSFADQDILTTITERAIIEIACHSYEKKCNLPFCLNNKKVRRELKKRINRACNAMRKEPAITSCPMYDLVNRVMTAAMKSMLNRRKLNPSNYGVIIIIKGRSMYKAKLYASKKIRV